MKLKTQMVNGVECVLVLYGEDGVSKMYEIEESYEHGACCLCPAVKRAPTCASPDWNCIEGYFAPLTWVPILQMRGITRYANDDD